MTKSDRIIADLMNALDSVLQESSAKNGSMAYIAGVASQAMKQCNAQRVRNSDGYLVVRNG